MINASTVKFYIIKVHCRFLSQVITQNSLQDGGNKATVTGIVLYSVCIRNLTHQTLTEGQDDIRELFECECVCEAE